MLITEGLVPIGPAGSGIKTNLRWKACRLEGLSPWEGWKQGPAPLSPDLGKLLQLINIVLHGFLLRRIYEASSKIVLITNSLSNGGGL